MRAADLRTAELADASGYSVQQIRQLETRGVLPAADRRANGYRSFSRLHLRALLAYRDLAQAVGPVVAREVMMTIQHLPLIDATARLSGLGHALEAERRQVLQARASLITIRSESATEPAAAEPEAATVPAADAGLGDSMTITELSQALGVPASTLRYWEAAGLVAPDRVEARAGTARIYRVTAIRDARITSALRMGGYRIPEVREAITALRELGDAARSLTALDERLETVARRTLALFRAGSVLVDLIDPGHR